MSANNQDSIFPVGNFINTIDRNYATAFEQFNCLRVVNERTVGVNAAAVFMLGNFQHNVYRSANSHAKSRSFCQLNCHLIFSFALK